MRAKAPRCYIENFGTNFHLQHRHEICFHQMLPRWERTIVLKSYHSDWGYSASPANKKIPNLRSQQTGGQVPAYAQTHQSSPIIAEAHNVVYVWPLGMPS
jgi:hypothetical protein